MELGAGSGAPGWELAWVTVWAGGKVMVGKGSLQSVTGKNRQITTLREGWSGLRAQGWWRKFGDFLGAADWVGRWSV